MLSPLVGHVTLGSTPCSWPPAASWALSRHGAALAHRRASSRGVGALVALYFSTLRSPFGFPARHGPGRLLFVFFGYRCAIRNRKFMPNGMMAVSASSSSA